ncbi:MAG: nucleotidyl transferase AbiEii/AbiGii toxin family protein [Candidatus Kapabacteria bacterium]|nr:nucleotidyl transferase AbiEii/AbiGii toxin family protein [Candidatus Kapabacteria bacterium]
MILHQDKKLFSDILRAASQQLGIKLEFIEKDYWITQVLSSLAKSRYVNDTVFKGGTSLSKGFGLIDRFSEDVDIAIINDSNKTGNEIKNIIRSTEKDITSGLSELQVEGITSKGSRFRKSVFEYLSVDNKNKNNKLIVEINSCANPFPFKILEIKSFIYDFLLDTKQLKYIDLYQLEPFRINVLNKEQTLIEKTVSLIRFSFAGNSFEQLRSKIRHFYDLYYLLNDVACKEFIETTEFRQKFDEVLNHDREIFEEPTGWKDNIIVDSPLINDFENIWNQLKDNYKSELSALAYTQIPDERKVFHKFKELMKRIQ